ncbi:MAG TPA: hypothetical protein DGD08_13255 [Gemmatimonas aurantiaca]|uniref:Uncharacterized protein n=3 Tax=Gemmatimonas aurantiaca TaxID=173480 RepID=C1AAM5_GEMAT|nr:hypothetical protein GAU_2781 [Gemmatimonas aurantiaca T-27]HCT58166.1 hypothetical protein [Gemmatimonas aurantiaca]
MPAMSLHRFRHRLPIVALGALALAACSDDDSPTGGNGGNTAPSSEYRRLVVSDTAPFARVFHAATGQRVDSLGGLPSRITYLYSPKGRVAFAHFQTRNRVGFIDGGVYAQGDRGVLSTPRLIGYFTDSVPIHGNYIGDQVSVHFDGSGNVRFFSEQAVAGGSLAPNMTINTGSAHHGAGMAMADGNFFSASLRDPAVGTSPLGVVVYNRAGQEVARNRDCTGLHGLAGNSTGSLYGCADGGLLVSATSTGPTFTKLTHATDPRFGVSTVWAHHSQTQFLVLMSIRGQTVSTQTRSLGVTNAGARTMQPIVLPNSDLDWTAGFDYSGKYAVVLGRSGNLYIVDIATRQVTGTLNAATPVMPTSGTVLTPFFAVAEGTVYLTSPTQGRVLELAISATGVPTLARTMTVGGTPERIVLLGVPENRTLQK